MNSAIPSSIPSFQPVSLNSTESIVSDPVIPSEQVTSAIIDRPEQIVSDNQMGKWMSDDVSIGMIIVNEEPVNNQIEQDTTPIGDNLQYDPRLLYHNPELQPGSIIMEDETPERENVNETYSQHEYCKRPRTAYNFFSKDYFGKMKNADSLRSSTDIIKEVISFIIKHFSYHQSGDLFRKKKEGHIMKVQGKIKKDMICIAPLFNRRRNKQEFPFFPKLEVDDCIKQIIK